MVEKRERKWRHLYTPHSSPAHGSQWQTDDPPIDASRFWQILAVRQSLTPFTHREAKQDIGGQAKTIQKVNCRILCHTMRKVAG